MNSLYFFRIIAKSNYICSSIVNIIGAYRDFHRLYIVIS